MIIIPNREIIGPRRKSRIIQAAPPPPPPPHGFGASPSEINIWPLLAGTCLLWLRSDLGVTNANTPSCKWRDQSNQGNSAAVSTFTVPTYSTGGLGGYPYFSGSSGAGFTGGVVINTGNPYEVCMVATSTGGSGGIIDLTGSGAGYPAITTVSNNVTQKLASSNINATALGATNAHYFLDAYFATSGAFLYANGTTTNSGASTGAITPNEGNGYFLLNTSAGAPMTGNLYEIALYSGALTTSARAAWKTYVTIRYGFTA